MSYNYKEVKLDENVRCRDLEVLHPVVKEKIKEFIRLSNDYLKSKDLQIFPIFTFRTAKQQQEAFDTGHSKARPGQSNHEFGLACDFGTRSSKNSYLDGSKNRSDVNLATETYRECFEKFGKGLGLEWGGNWISIKDYPHFQYVKNTKNLNDKELRQYLKNGGDSSIIK